MPNHFDAIIADRLNATEKIINSIGLDDQKKDLMKASWVDFIKLMECLTKKHYIRYNTLNLITIIAGVLIPVIINIEDKTNCTKVIGTILGVLVSVSASINQSYRFNDRWRHFRLMAEELKIEGEKYLSLTEKYKDFESHDKGAFKLFMANVENIKEGQINSYMRKITLTDNKQEESDKNEN